MDILCFGAHPDDVEIGMGGTIAKHTDMGYKVEIVDLTCGEMGTRGTPEARWQEAQNAAKILGADRERLFIPDRKIELSDENILKVARSIRQHSPKVIAMPYWDDRHPDHVNASKLVYESAFSAGLAKFDPETEPHKASTLMYYFLNYDTEPDFIVDITDYYEKKLLAVSQHQTQFGDFNFDIKNFSGYDRLPPQFIRNKYYGNMYNLTRIPFAEAFVMKKKVLVDDVLKL